MFVPKLVLYEENILEYPLGKELYTRYNQMGVEMRTIENHNNIYEMRTKENKEFPSMKQNLIIATRKTHKFVPNHKTSDFLVPYTSSGCIAMCLYCYLVCNYNKCAYLRLFVNREEMFEKIIKTANKAEKELVFEIGSNSDLILENTITGNLEWTIKEFANRGKGKLTLPTKFDMVDNLLPLDHKGKTIIRMSINPKVFIRKIEIGTSPLENRVKALNKLKEAGYPIGILIAPIMLIDNWQNEYEELFKYLADNLNEEVKKDVAFEFIFMTYSYVHKMINQEAFPSLTVLYDANKMTGRGKGKYSYKKEIREEAEKFILELMKKYFPNNKIEYVV